MEKKRILIIDDEVDFTELVKMSLENSGLYEVRIENDSRLALTAAREFRPDLILLDIIMPHMDGTEVARKIRGDSVVSDTPIVFLTATVTKAEIDPEDGTIGGRAFLAKPINALELTACIEKHIKR